MMDALQIWLQNHNRKLNQEAIDVALMEYITMIECQRDELLAALVKVSATRNIGSAHVVASEAIQTQLSSSLKRLFR
jgi:hypothetical protein